MSSLEPTKDTVARPRSIAHIVLRTSPEGYAAMVKFYQQFFGAHIIYENEFITFLAYDEEHHRIAIFAGPGTVPKPPRTSGLEHIAFSFNTLNELALSYKQKKTLGITPFWTVNHGPTTSMYYRDPDGNQLETEVDNMDVKTATEFMYTPEFVENPYGVDFDPEEFVARVERGEDDALIKKRKNIGRRGPPAHAA